MTPGRVRRLALSLPDAEEHRQRGRSSFQVRGRTFATLATRESAVLELSHDEQDVLTRAHPGVFAAGGPRRRGHTVVELRRVDAWLFEELLVAAWRRVAPRRSAARWDAERTAAALPVNGRPLGSGGGHDEDGEAGRGGTGEAVRRGVASPSVSRT